MKLLFFQWIRTRQLKSFQCVERTVNQSAHIVDSICKNTRGSLQTCNKSKQKYSKLRCAFPWIFSIKTRTNVFVSNINSFKIFINDFIHKGPIIQYLSPVYNITTAKQTLSSSSLHGHVGWIWLTAQPGLVVAQWINTFIQGSERSKHTSRNPSGTSLVWLHDKGILRIWSVRIPQEWRMNPSLALTL